ncbi:peroxiredoxin [bacterium SCSIO 12741]|nr:peroxiredoxin [bacterium SCSIO 12741]
MAQSELKIGDHIPAFETIDQDSNSVTLESILGQGPVVLYFYPKDHTPGCTKEACSFRDEYHDFQDLGATIYGISNDSPKSHREFIEKHRLPYSLLCDQGNKLRKLFGVPTGWLGLIPSRVTYIIDEQGVVQYVFNSQLNPEQHIKESLRVIRGMTSTNEGNQE